MSLDWFENPDQVGYQSCRAGLFLPEIREEIVAAVAAAVIPVAVVDVAVVAVADGTGVAAVIVGILVIVHGR